jgi:phosphatidylinositol alpha 1,6-mannosyltransferase
MLTGPRVAFFADSFHEVNGQALTSRELVSYAERHGQPMLSVRFGTRPRWVADHPVTTLELTRSSASFKVERDLSYDPLVWRYTSFLERVLRKYRTEVIHVTTPGDLGQMGALLAHRLRVPLVVSWHTHLHEFGATRLDRLLDFLPRSLRRGLVKASERVMAQVLLRFYRLGRAVLAPSNELVEWLARETGRPAFLMPRGVDTTLFRPERRDAHDGVFRLGFVGRLSTEKNVRLLAAVERELRAAGCSNYQFLVVGDGSERSWLEANLPHAEFTGILSGEALARAYANMDAFLFPSQTDSYGNVVAEALASGVPCVVTDRGGPQHQIAEGITGFITHSDAEFVAAARRLVEKPLEAAAMRAAAWQSAAGRSWDAAFDPVWKVYQAVALIHAATCQPIRVDTRVKPRPAPVPRHRSLPVRKIVQVARP